MSYVIRVNEGERAYGYLGSRDGKPLEAGFILTGERVLYLDPARAESFPDRATATLCAARELTQFQRVEVWQRDVAIATERAAARGELL